MAYTETAFAIYSILFSIWIKTSNFPSFLLFKAPFMVFGIFTLIDGLQRLGFLN